jgi:hypothetical protein
MHSNISQIIGNPQSGFPVVVAAAGRAVIAGPTARTIFIQNIGTNAATVAHSNGGTPAVTLAADTGADAGAGGSVWFYGCGAEIWIAGTSPSVRVTVYS